MGLIKIGIESTKSKLYRQLLLRPERYFFILVTEGSVILAIQTCDKQGENTIEHEIECLTYDQFNGLVSVFQEDLWAAMAKRELYIKYLDGDRYPISSAIRKKIAEIPELIEGVISIIQNEDRCLMYYMP